MSLSSFRILGRSLALVLALAAVACDDALHDDESVHAALIEVDHGPEPRVTVLVENHGEASVADLVVPYTSDDDGRVVGGGLLALPGTFAVAEVRELQVPVHGARPGADVALSAPIPGGSALMTCAQWTDQCYDNAEWSCESGVASVTATCAPSRRCSFTCLPEPSPNPGAQKY